MKAKALTYLLIALGLIPLIYWSYHYINYDVWYDEAYSLEHFALVDFNTTLFYYPAPNNHIFFNHTSQMLSRLFGLRDLFQATDMVHVFRVFQLLIALATACYSVKLLKKLFGYSSKWLVVVILFTTLPFMNFALQLRGYNMSSLFLVMLVYYAWSFLETPNLKGKIWMVVLSVLLLYTIPSNVYFLLAFWLVVLAFGIYSYRKNGGEAFKPYKWILVCIASGVVIALALYAPILEEVLFNKFSTRTTPGIFYSAGLFLDVIPAFLAKRYLLVLFALAGVFAYVKKMEASEKRNVLMLLGLFLLPFAISFLHQKAPFPRVFITLAPIFGILLTVPIIKFIASLSNSNTRLGLQLLITGYCIATFVYTVEHNRGEISQNLIENNQLDQNLSKNYYLGSFFQQDPVMEQLKIVYAAAPVFTYRDLDAPSTELYLQKNDIHFERVNNLALLVESIPPGQVVYVLTSEKNNTLQELEAFPKIEAEVISDPNRFTNSIKLEKKSL